MTNLLASLGVSIGGRILGGLFGGGGEPAEPAWGAQRTYFEHQLRKMLRPQREEALSSLRLEASRGGGLSGGAYLSGVVDIQKKFNEVMGRELSAYEMQQASARAQWGMQKSMMQAQQPSRLGQVFEGIAGDIAGYYDTRALEQKRESYYNKLSFQKEEDKLFERVKSILPYIDDPSMKKQLIESLKSYLPGFNLGG
jgi:hypothetical protein